MRETKRDETLKSRCPPLTVKRKENFSKEHNEKRSEKRGKKRGRERVNNFLLFLFYIFARLSSFAISKKKIINKRGKLEKKQFIVCASMRNWSDMKTVFRNDQNNKKNERFRVCF